MESQLSSYSAHPSVPARGEAARKSFWFLETRPKLKLHAAKADGVSRMFVTYLIRGVNLECLINRKGSQLIQLTYTRLLYISHLVSYHYPIRFPLFRVPAPFQGVFLSARHSSTQTVAF
jgi:hypothetical protein